jgi:hypothetical protein
LLINKKRSWGVLDLNIGHSMYPWFPVLQQSQGLNFHGLLGPFA